jgi:hypothetical protein
MTTYDIGIYETCPHGVVLPDEWEKVQLNRLVADIGKVQSSLDNPELIEELGLMVNTLLHLAYPCYTCNTEY